MNDVRRGGRLDAAFGLFAAALLAFGCSGLPTRGPKASLAGGKLSPSAAPAANYGPDASYTCPSTEILRLVGGELDRANKGKPATSDGRLCAAAEALLAWPTDNTPPESVMRFISWHFGLPAAIRGVIISTLSSEDPAELAPRLAEPIASFMGVAADPRYGVATTRVRKEELQSRAAGFSAATRVVILMHDMVVELQPLPRKLAAGGTAPIAGKVAAGIEKPQVLVCDSQGKLQSTKPIEGSAFQSEVKCGDKPGRAIVEIRGEMKGGLVTLASFPVSCGGEIPAAVDVPAESKSTDVAADEKKLFDSINQERTSNGLAPLASDATVAKAARSMAESEKQQVTTGAAGLSLDPVGKLKEAGFVSPVVLHNPAQARNADEAHARFTLSAVHRCNMLSNDVTHAGVGESVAPGAKPGDPSSVFVSELLVKELAAIDTEALKTKLRSLLAEKREAARASKLKDDAMLDRIAQEYAAEIAAAGGTEDKEKTAAIVRPLYSGYRTVDIIGGAKNDPLEFTEEPGIVKDGKVYGLGVAQGKSAVLGENAVYVIIIIGTKK